MGRPSMRASIANFRDYDAPFATKVRLLFANNLTKLRFLNCDEPYQSSGT